MISKKAIHAEMKRLFRLPLAPTEDEDIRSGREEITRVFEKYCTSDEHLALVIDSVCESALYFPPVAVIVEAAKSITPPEVATENAPAGCDECGGSGWLRTEQVDRFGQTVSAVAPCGCDLGRWRKTRAALSVK